jgi:ribulose-bisphosphate carboxylase large chain
MSSPTVAPITGRFTAVYRVRADAASIEDRASAIAVEQSVEMPLAAIDDAGILADIVGRVDAIRDLGAGTFEVRIELAAATVGDDAGQLLNMLFGNTSLHDDVILHDVLVPPSFAASFGGSRHGIAGLRQRVGATGRALTCSALKPQGLSAARLGELAERFALGGLDFIKDDHGLADQAYAPFAERVLACAEGVRRAAATTGRLTRYVPSLSGDLDRLRRQIVEAREAGIDTVLVAPMVIGLATFQALVREHGDIAFFAHPAMAGTRIAPELLIGKLFPLLGADAVIFPSHGGRFGYTAETCSRLAANARTPGHGQLPSCPVPAGGMTLPRVAELLEFYGSDAMLLLGGSLLAAGAELVAATTAFSRAVSNYPYR